MFWSWASFRNTTFQRSNLCFLVASLIFLITPTAQEGLPEGLPEELQEGLQKPLERLLEGLPKGFHGLAQGLTHASDGLSRASEALGKAFEGLLIGLRWPLKDAKMATGPLRV